MAGTTPASTPFPVLCALSRETLGLPPRPIPSSASMTLSDIGIASVQAYTPNKPIVSLFPAAVQAFLSCELDAPVLDELYSKLWLVARRSGRSTDPLHRQKVKGREIVPTEDPKLHLVWQHDKIYVKPIPVCLLSHEFWTTHLPVVMNTTSSRNSNSQHKRDQLVPRSYHSVAVGFLRSYAFLVQHQLDFNFAHESHLIPREINRVEWSRFIADFREIEDYQVAKRYHYGQLRLSRLNWIVRMFRPRTASTMWFYELPYWSIGSYEESAFAPFLIMFACLSIVLSSMQVVLAVPTDGPGALQMGSSGLVAMSWAFSVFSISVLILSGVIWFLVIVVPFSMIMWQLSWGFRNRGRNWVQGAAAA